MKPSQITTHNRHAWDKLASDGKCDWTKPVTSAEVEHAREGHLNLYLTPTKPVPTTWLGNLKGCRTLCLAGGGGQQAPLLAAAGALVTVLDNSPKQLASDALVAEREGLTIDICRGDMSDLSAFAEESFDLIVHPVSNCFVPDIRLVWNEAARVLRTGGALLSGFTNPVVYLFDYLEEMANQRLVVTHRLPYSPFSPTAQAERELCLERGEALEFGHTLEDQLAGQLEAGLVLVGLYEDTNRPSSRSLLDKFTALYMATQAVKMKVAACDCSKGRMGEEKTASARCG